MKLLALLSIFTLSLTAVACTGNRLPVTPGALALFGTLAENYPYEVVACKGGDGYWRVPEITLVGPGRIVHTPCPPGTVVHWHSHTQTDGHPSACEFSAVDVKSSKRTLVPWQIVSTGEGFHCWWTAEQVAAVPEGGTLATIPGQRTW